MHSGVFGGAGLTFVVDLLADTCQPFVLDCSVTTIDVVERVADEECAASKQDETEN